MNKIFDLAFDVMAASYQVALLAGAALCLGLGGLMLGSWLYHRWRGAKVSGSIIGIKQRGAYYHPVYRYRLASGQSYEAVSDTGSGDPSGMKTGKLVPLLVMPDSPDKAYEARNGFFNTVGAILVITGVVLGSYSLTAFPLTRWTFGALALFGVYGGLKFYRAFIPKDKRPSPAAWKQQNAAAFADAPLLTHDQFLATPAGVKLLQDRKLGRRRLKPVLAIAGPLLLLGGLYVGQNMLRLEQNGVRVAGTVVALERSGAGEDETYYPVVRFSSYEGAAYQFKDRTGSNPPSYRPGADVGILYLAADPQQSALIDRGIWNWLLPILLSGLGLAAIVGFLALIRKPRENTDHEKTD